MPGRQQRRRRTAGVGHGHLTGKTKIVIDLLANWHCKTILILCPLSVRGVWRREIDKHSPVEMRVCIPEKGSTKQKTADADRALQHAMMVGKPIVLVMNYDAAKMSAFAEWSLSQKWDCVILDESHRAKGHNSLTSKYCAKLGRLAKHRLCLTGTPLAQSPLDIFGQFRFLDAGLFGTSWHHFSNRYAIKGNPYIPQMITGYKNEDELQQRMALLTYHCAADDVLDLPAVLHQDLTCELCPAARESYDELENELITEVGTGVVTAGNALVKLLRLQQLSSGYLCEDETGKVHRLDTGKEELLYDLLTDAGGEPCVVFCRFREDLATVKRLCEKIGLRYGELSGSDKDGLNDRGEMAEGVQVLGAQIQSGGVGVDLTRARLCCYFSVGFSLTDYEQSLARLHRPGQIHPVIYYHLVCVNTVDQRVYAALDARKNVIDAVLKGLKNENEAQDGEGNEDFARGSGEAGAGECD